MNIEVFNFLLAPFTMCILLVAIHVYLGLHVLARKVIFVDLALAQMAALGMVIALIMGFSDHSLESYFISLTATLIAAFIFAVGNSLTRRVSQEAFIGVIYAFSSAAAIVLMDHVAHGTEHLKSALVGQLLWVSWQDVGKVAFIYTVISFLHFIFRKQLMANSLGRLRDWRWDFFFYALFGVVITSSVQISGVLLVFSFLIVPALVSALFFDGLRQRLLFGWLFGAFLCALGLFLSVWIDSPSGATIVVVFTCLPILLVIGLGVAKGNRKHKLTNPIQMKP